MKCFTVQLTSITDVRKFVDAACAQSFDIIAVSGHNIVDAKSIMDMFSIDLSKTIQVEAIGERKECEDFYDAVKEFEVL